MNAILEDKNCDLWIGSTNGLFHYERGADKIRPFFKGKFVKQTGSIATVYALHEDAAGRLWIGTETNLYVVKDPTDVAPVKIFEGRESLPEWQMQEGVFSILEDRQGRVYAATSNGLWQVKSDFSFRQFAPDEGEKSASLGFQISDAESSNGDTL